MDFIIADFTRGPPPGASFLPSSVATPPSITLKLLQTIAIRFVVMQCIYYAAGFVMPRISKTFSKFADKDKVEWRMKLVASLHGFLCIYFSVITILRFDGEARDVYQNLIGAISPTVEDGCLWSLGYFAHDFAANVYHYPTLKKTTVLIHHFVVAVSAATVVFFHVGAFVGAVTWLVEISDVLSHVTWMAGKVTSRDSDVFLASHLLQYVTFIATRFFINSWVVYHSMMHGWTLSLFYSLPVTLINVPWMIFWLLNIYWCHRYHVSIRRTLKARRGEKPSRPAAIRRVDSYSGTPAGGPPTPYSYGLDAMSPDSPMKKKQ